VVDAFLVKTGTGDAVLPIIILGGCFHSKIHPLYFGVEFTALDLFY